MKLNTLGLSTILVQNVGKLCRRLMSTLLIGNPDAKCPSSEVVDVRGPSWLFCVYTADVGRLGGRDSIALASGSIDVPLVLVSGDG